MVSLENDPWSGGAPNHRSRVRRGLRRRAVDPVGGDVVEPATAPRRGAPSAEGAALLDAGAVATDAAGATPGAAADEAVDPPKRRVPGRRPAARNGAGRQAATRAVDGATSEELLARYQRRRTARLREALVERHRGDVEAIARNLAARLPARVEVEDLVHAGIWGLLQAIEKFRPERGAPFKPFMRPRVRGAMLDELRNLDFLPRLYRRRQREREAATIRVRERLGREPSDAELSEELGVDEARFRRLYGRMSVDGLGAAEANRMRALDGEWADALPDDRSSCPLAEAERLDLLRAIERSLQPIEWTVLRLHYLEGMSGREIAERLQLSAARICQIHVRVLQRLKTRLSASSRR